MSLLQYSVVFILIQYGTALSKGEGCLQAEKKTCILELANLPSWHCDIIFSCVHQNNSKIWREERQANLKTTNQKKKKSS